MSSRLAAEVAELKQKLATAESNLEEANKRLHEVERLKSAFLATVSHELRTPLTSVIGYSEMLRDGFGGTLTNAQGEFVGTILEKSNELLARITELLTASELEADGVVLESKPIDVESFLHGILDAMPHLEKKNRVVITSARENSPRALADPIKLRHVITHLLANAAKFSPAGKPIEVAISVGPVNPREPVATEGEQGLRVCVRDFGIGIASDQQQRIFEPFFQADSSTTREYGGLGLGLSLAKLYVEAHGGHIWVESQVGSGSAFTVSLPGVAEEIAAYVGEVPGV